MSRQFVGPIRARFDFALPATAVVLYRSYLFVFDVLDLFISTCTLKSTILLECSDIRIELFFYETSFTLVAGFYIYMYNWVLN